VERIGELLGMAKDQTLRAGEIIRRMRAFTARGEVEIRPESVEQTVRDAVELVLVGTGQFHIRVDYDFDPDAEQMLADRIQVQQVLVNLLRNSVDALRNAGPGSRQINLCSRKVKGNMVEIEIADTGPGIPSTVLDQLFSRFTTTKSERGGMGIGLSISKRIIEAHGGELKAINRQQGGASFRFTIPAVDQEMEA
jgi:two-component system sensor kinase FixL